MRSVVLAGLLLAASTTLVHADPACAVSIVRAPDEVRAAVEAWLANNSCGVPLTVRIIESENGFYLFAQDDHGNIYERTVPDAQSAGVLIASWSADDGLVDHTVAATPEVTSEPTATIEPSGIEEEEDDYPVLKHEKPSEQRWLTLAVGAAGSNSGRGVRAELEVWRAGGFSADIAGAYGGSDMLASDGTTTYRAHFDDVTAMMGLHYTARTGDWHVRAGFAVGATATQLSLQTTASSAITNGNDATWMLEGSIMIGRTIGDRWEVELGPIASLGNETWHMSEQMETLVRAPGSLIAFAGIRRAL